MDKPIDGLARAERLHDAGNLLGAGRLYAEVLQQQPANVRAWRRLGEAYHALGQPAEAAECYRRALAFAPDDLALLNNLGAALMAQGLLSEAAQSLAAALRVQPNSVEACSNLGLILLHQGQADGAIVHLRHATRLQPGRAEVHNHLGMAHMNHGNTAEAVTCFQRAVSLRPDLAEAHVNLGMALATQKRPDEALACYERAVQLDANPTTVACLGDAYRDQGRAADAIARYREALAQCPDDPRLHSNLLLALLYQWGDDPRAILPEAQRYAERHAAPLSAALRPHKPRPRSGRRLRVGYVSPDLRDHPISYFLEPILAAHDHQAFEIVCYADVARPDDVTARLRAYRGAWRSLVGLSDEQAAEQIRHDDIDILVDLAGHCGGNRLLTFARRPAPIQASYMGYLGTTGLPAMDYYLTDPLADPPGMTEDQFTERLVRLPDCGMCYRQGAAPDVVCEPPAQRSGQVTFGSLNALIKVGEPVLALWGQVLCAVPRSRLLVVNAAGSAAAARLQKGLANAGVSADRLVLVGPAATRFDYLTLYQLIDVGLDPFPYNGVTTTCDALWMGVPVVTLAGRTSVSRQGVRFLRSAGLDELVAETSQAYVRLAAELAGDVARLSAYRAGLRTTMTRSPLMDGPRFTRNLEAAYRTMWNARAGGTAE